MLIYGIVASEQISAPSPQGPPPGAPARFIAVGTDQNFDIPILMTTEDDDALTWVDRSIAAASAVPIAVLQDVAYSPSLDRWVAVGWENQSSNGNPRVIYSDDGGNTWTAATADPSSSFQIYGICWTGSLFIAVGKTAATNVPRIMTSSNGISWTAQTSTPSTATHWQAVHGVSGLAIVVGGVGEFSSPDKVSTSANNGVSWTARTAPTSPNFLQDVVCVSGGTHVCVGFSSLTNKIASSSDGITWTNQTGPSDQQYYGIAWNGSLYVAVGMDDSTNLEARIATSTAGVVWTARTADPVSVTGGDGPNLLSVTAGVSGGFVAVGRDNNTFNIPYIMYSAAGTTWTARTPDPTTGCVLQGVGARP